MICKSKWLTHAGLRCAAISLLLLSAMLQTVSAQSRRGVDKSTDCLMFVPAATGMVISLVEKDYQGLKQLALSGATSAAANYLLELSIKKDRPDGTGCHAFPSTHATAAFAGAAFLQRRYGWKWGAPAYVLSTYVAWGRIFAKKHDIWDVLGGAAIGAGSSYIFTRPFTKKGNIVLSPIVVNDRPGVYLSATF